MSKFRDPDPHLKAYGRKMRREATDAERRLWSMLRGGKLGGCKFRRQHPVAGYIADFYCHERRLIVESDGGQHFDPKAIEYDQRRTEKLNELGIGVLRFQSNEVLKYSEAVFATIFHELTENAPSPLPSPGVPGEGVVPSRAGNDIP